MTAPLVLAGLDVGSTSTKAVLCTPQGHVLGSASRPTPLGEHDAPQLLAHALAALTEAATAAGRTPDAVGVTGMAETGVPLDAQGHPAGPLLPWTDPRGADQAAALAGSVGTGPLHAATGVRPSAKAPLAKWRLLREKRPDVLRRMHAWAGAADLVVHALTGRLVTDPTLAQRTMAYDVHRGDWSEELTALAGLTPAHLPDVRPSGAPAGTVTADGARRAPVLRPGTPVAVAGHDHPVGAWAAGVRTAGAAADSMGTAEAVLTLTDAPPDPAAALARGMGFGRHVDGAHWYVLAGTGSCGALVEWCAGLLGLPGGPQRPARFGALLEEAGPGPTGIVVEPYLRGRAAPAPDPDRTVTVHGLRAEDGPARLALAVVEATAYQARWMTEAQAELTGRTPHRVVLLGGPVAQPRWPRVKAAVSPWATALLRQPLAPAVGAALLAGAGAGLCPSAALPTEEAHGTGQEDAVAYDAVHRHHFLPRVTTPNPHPAPDRRGT
jgi:xylulokinase